MINDKELYDLIEETEMVIIQGLYDLINEKD